MTQSVTRSCLIIVNQNKHYVQHISKALANYINVWNNISEFRSMELVFERYGRLDQTFEFGSMDLSFLKKKKLIISEFRRQYVF